MILKKIRTEHTDEKTGSVVKKIITSEWETLNHKLAINNMLFSCEQERLLSEKPLLNSPFQIHHIFYHNKRNVWLFDKMLESKAHAGKFGRFFLPFQNRNIKQWKKLTFSEAESDFIDLASRGLSLVPYSIPLDADLEKWKIRKADAQSILSPSQTLVSIFCSKHNINLFEDIFNYEFENSKIIGVQCYSLNDAVTNLNLSTIKLRNMKLQKGDEAPLLIGLNYEKVLRKLFNVSGSFAYSCFGFDIFSCRQICVENMPPDALAKMLSKTIDEIMKYDRTLGGFNRSAEQEFWNGKNLTKELLEKIDLTEGLSKYEAIQWANHLGQQKDFDLLNDYILETAIENREDSALNFIQSDKEKWAVFWKTKITKEV